MANRDKFHCTLEFWQINSYIFENTLTSYLKQILTKSSHLCLRLQSGCIHSCTHFSSLTCVLHVPPISSSVIWSPTKNLWRCSHCSLLQLFLCGQNSLNVHRSFTVRDQVAYLNKTSGKITVLYIWIIKNDTRWWRLEHIFEFHYIFKEFNSRQLTVFLLCILLMR